MVLGTVGYMSPVQVRASRVDHRSDLFSLGIVLYEMLSGARPFTGGSAVETMNAILTQDPPALIGSGRTLPPALAEVVRHALEKQPDERFQSARDMAFALQAASGPISGSIAEPASGQPAVPAAATRVSAARRAMPIAAAAALFGAIAGATALWLTMPPAPTTDVRNRRFTPLAADATVEESPSWSPDGRSLAYFSSVGPVASLVVKDLGGSAPVTLVRNLRGARRDVFWWPDGSRIGYVDHGGIQVVSRAGGDPELLQPGDIMTASLSPDGRALAFWKVTTSESSGTAALWVASPPNAAAVKYARAFAEAPLNSPVYVRYAPGGSRLLLTGFLPDPANPKDTSPGVWEITGSALDTMGAPRRVFGGMRWVPPAFSWLPDGRVMLASVGSPGLWMGDVDRGTLVKITDGLGGEHGPSASPDGRRIAFESRRDNFDAIDIPLDGSPVVDVLAASPAEAGASRASDGRIVYVSDASGAHEIRVRAPDGTDRVVVGPRDFPGETDTGIALLSPTISPDGGRVLFTRLVRAVMDIWIAPMSGGTPVRASPPGRFATMPEWSPDGRWIAFATRDSGTRRLARQRVGSSDPAQDLADLTGASSGLAWSPDGAWIAHDSPAGVSLVAPEGRARRVLAPGVRPRAFAWSHDSRTLYGLQEDPDGSRVIAINAASGSVRVARPLPPELIFSTPVSPGLRLTVSADERRLLTTVLRAHSDIWMMEGF
jgi:Tol biopolymer transport system component